MTNFFEKMKLSQQQLPEESIPGESEEKVLERKEENSEVISESKTHIEERPFWGEFRGGEIDKVGEYRKPTPEQKERLEKRLERLSEIFENADFQWYLDGAINISLYKDEQIRDHKDLDISVFREDLAKLNELLAEQDFTIFVNYEENGKRLMRKITVEELATLEKPDLSICKTGPDGKIQRNTEDPFNFVDLHIHSKDAEGNTVVFYNGATLPKEFFNPVKKKLPNGKEINLSQPAIVAYHKLHSDRPYDLTDLEKLRPYLQEKDFLMLRESFAREAEKTEMAMREKIQEVWESLRQVLELTRDSRVINETIWRHPDLQKRRSDRRVSEFVSAISQYVSENPDITFDDFLDQSFAILNPQKRAEQKLEIIAHLEKS